MPIRIDLPESVEDRLRAELGDVDAAAKEALLVELYRQGALSHGELAQALGLSRPQVDGVLSRHNVVEDLLTSEELAAQVEGLRQLVRP